MNLEILLNQCSELRRKRDYKEANQITRLITIYSIFDFHILMEAINELIGFQTGEKVYLNVAPKEKWNICFEDKYGKTIYSSNRKCSSHLSREEYEPVIKYYQIMFKWINPMATPADSCYVYQEASWKRKALESMFTEKRYSVEVLNSECDFDTVPYVKDFIYYLINYRIAHELLEISDEQIKFALQMFMKESIQKQKTLLPKKN